MKKHIRNIAFFVCMLIFFTLLPSCKEDDGSGYIFKMNIESNPKNLDPQMATDKESMMVIVNMMEGLMKTDGTGAIVPAAAESFEMSEDGLKYTFHLRRDRKWESLMEDFSAPVTADDFVFAFQRIFNGETASPHSGDFSCIKNGTAVLKGMVPSSELGVRAVDEYTVEFTLEYPYYDFLKLLTETAAMPCCREFFELSKGRYGMAADAAASNGAFYIKEWNFDPYWDNNYIIMRRNKSYSEVSYVYPYSVNFFITGDSSLDKEDFSADNVQCFVSDEYDEKLFEESSYIGREVKTAGLLINPDSEYLSDKRFREALARSVNRDSYSRKLSPQFTPAYGLIPAGITVQGTSYRELFPDRSLSVYSANAAELWENALKAAGTSSVDGVKITVSENFLGSEAVYDITDRWRSELLFSCGVETVSQTEYDDKISSGDFSVALVEIGTDKNSPEDFLGNFCGNELFGGNAGLAADISGLKKAGSLSDGVEMLGKAEEKIIGEYLFIPVCYESEYLVYDVKAAELAYYPFSSAVWFGDAKYFD